MSTTPPLTGNVDAAELAKFSDLAHRWWDTASEFKPLHAINPLRLNWIDSIATIVGKRVLDVGCGGGILAESMARKGADVTGIDLAEKSLKVAKLHAIEAQVKLNYENISAEAIAEREPQSFDVVTCMEMLEHVPDPSSIVSACTKLLKPEGYVFFSTLNRNTKSFLFAVVGAEYALGLLPKGTHEYTKFIKPHELLRVCRDNGLSLLDIKGMSYSPLTEHYALNSDTSVNYLVALKKSA